MLAQEVTQSVQRGHDLVARLKAAVGDELDIGLCSVARDLVAYTTTQHIPKQHLDAVALLSVQNTMNLGQLKIQLKIRFRLDSTSTCSSRFIKQVWTHHTARTYVLMHNTSPASQLPSLFSDLRLEQE